MRIRSIILILILMLLIGCSKLVYPKVSYNSSSKLAKYSPVAIVNFSNPITSPFMITEYSSKAGLIVTHYLEMYMPMIGFRIINRDSVRHIIDEQTFQFSGLVEHQAIRLGKMVGARSIIIGNVVKFKITREPFMNPGSEVFFTIKMLDVETGDVLFIASAQYPVPVELNLETNTENLVKEVVNRMQSSY